MTLGIRLGLAKPLERARSVINSLSPVTILNGQTLTVTAPAGTWTVATIIFSSIPTPVGMQIVENATNYDFDGVDWIDLNTFSPGNADPIAGSFDVVNNSGGSYTFWDISPP